jgi:hypothetical protein
MREFTQPPARELGGGWVPHVTCWGPERLEQQALGGSLPGSKGRHDGTTKAGLGPLDEVVPDTTHSRLCVKVQGSWELGGGVAGPTGLGGGAVCGSSSHWAGAPKIIVRELTELLPMPAMTAAPTAPTFPFPLMSWSPLFGPFEGCRGAATEIVSLF